MQGQAGARAGEKDYCAMLGHPAGYSIRGTQHFSPSFLISHDQNTANSTEMEDIPGQH